MGGDEIVHLNEALIKHGHEQATSQLRREKWQRVRQQHTTGAVLCRNEQQERGHRSSLGRRPSREAAYNGYIILRPGGPIYSTCGRCGGPVLMFTRVGPFRGNLLVPPGVACHTSQHTITH